MYSGLPSVKPSKSQLFWLRMAYVRLNQSAIVMLCLQVEGGIDQKRGHVLASRSSIPQQGADASHLLQPLSSGICHLLDLSLHVEHSRDRAIDEVVDWAHFLRAIIT